MLYFKQFLKNRDAQLYGTLQNEVVAGFRRVQQAGPYTDLGQHGWFKAISMGKSIEKPEDEIEQEYNQLPDILDGLPKDKWLEIPDNFRKLYYKDLPDEFAEKFDGKILKEISQRLQDLGFKKMNCYLIFVDYLAIKSEVGDAQGTYTSSHHVIKMPKNLPENRMMHAIAHEWAHQFYKYLDKQSKSYFAKYYFNYLLGQGQKISFYSESNPDELFCELVGTAVANPSQVPPDMIKLLRTIASGTMPETKINTFAPSKLS